MRPVAACAVLAAVLLATACSPDEADTAVVTGRLVQAGGPAGSAPLTLAGKVAFTSDDRTVTVPATEDGGYRAHLPAGLWTVRGFAPNAQGALVPCAAVPQQVLVPGAQETRKDVLCRSTR